MDNTKTTLISEICNYFKNTHNEQDLKNLQEFSVEKLNDILNEIKDIVHIQYYKN